MPSGGIAGGDPVSLVSSQLSLIVFDQSYFFLFRISRIKHHKLSLALRDRSSPCFMVSLINNIECINIPSLFPTLLPIIMGWNQFLLPSTGQLHIHRNGHGHAKPDTIGSWAHGYKFEIKCPNLALWFWSRPMVTVPCSSKCVYAPERTIGHTCQHV